MSPWSWDENEVMAAQLTGQLGNRYWSSRAAVEAWRLVKALMLVFGVRFPS